MYFVCLMSISQDPSQQLSRLVPSQGTERTSEISSDISVPQGHQETGPIAGRNRIFSSENAPWTPRGRDNEDREVMSNDTRIIIPEVKYQAVGAHCKKLDIQGCVTGVQKE